MIQLTAAGRAGRTEAVLRQSQLARSLGLALLLLGIAGCPQPKEPPVIESIDGSRSVEARDSAGYTCNASDPDLKQLSYSWSQEGGSLGWDWGRNVRWFAPESSGRAFLHVIVTDEDGLSAVDSLDITVRAETTDILNWDGAVKAGQYQQWPDSVFAGYRLYGYCVCDSGSLILKVMDDSSFAAWVAGRAVSPLWDTIVPDKWSAFAVPIEDSGLYHIIMDNKDGTGDYNYALHVWRLGP
jgi:hypothetical protein